MGGICAIVRRAYARQMLASVGVDGNQRTGGCLRGHSPRALRRAAALAAFARRPLFRPELRDDPVVLYQDVLVALAPERGVNNGSPSLHALWLDRLAPQAGERVVHIGAGTGYYSCDPGSSSSGLKARC